MDWKTLRAEHTELGRSTVVARPALVMEFYGTGRKMAPHGRQILDRFSSVLPPGTQLYVLGNNDREYKKVTPQSRRRIEKTLDELAQRGRFYSFKDAPEFDVGTFSLEVHLGSQHDNIADTVQLAYPLDWGEQARVEKTTELFAGFARDFPFWGGVAGYGFDLVWGREFEQRGMPVNFSAAKRFHGLLVRHRTQENYLVKKLKSAGWLTYLDAEMVGALGGEHELRSRLGDEATLTNAGPGVLLRAGATPPIGDVNRQRPDVAPLATVNRAIEQVRIDRWFTTDLFGVDRESADAWLHRFD
jgi:hypothetical protein